MGARTRLDSLRQNLQSKSIKINKDALKDSLFALVITTSLFFFFDGITTDGTASNTGIYHSLFTLITASFSFVCCLICVAHSANLAWKDMIASSELAEAVVDSIFEESSFFRRSSSATKRANDKTDELNEKYRTKFTFRQYPKRDDIRFAQCMKQLCDIKYNNYGVTMQSWLDMSEDQKIPKKRRDRCRTLYEFWSQECVMQIFMVSLYSNNFLFVFDSLLQDKDIF